MPVPRMPTSFCMLITRNILGGHFEYQAEATGRLLRKNVKPWSTIYCALVWWQRTHNAWKKSGVLRDSERVECFFPVSVLGSRKKGRETEHASLEPSTKTKCHFKVTNTRNLCRGSFRARLVLLCALETHKDISVVWKSGQIASRLRHSKCLGFLQCPHGSQEEQSHSGEFKQRTWVFSNSKNAVGLCAFLGVIIINWVVVGRNWRKGSGGEAMRLLPCQWFPRFS